MKKVLFLSLLVLALLVAICTVRKPEPILEPILEPDLEQEPVLNVETEMLEEVSDEELITE
jgi:hypothetical protein